MDMPMSSMGHGSHGSGPSFDDIYHGYWGLVGAVVAVAAASHAVNWVIYYRRMAAAKKDEATPAKPRSRLAQTYAGLVAIVREAGNAAPAEMSAGDLVAGMLPPTLSKRRRLAVLDRVRIRLPSVGSVVVVVGYAVTVLVMSFFALDPSNRWSYEAVAMRIGHVTIMQFPLVVLLAGRTSIIGTLTGVGYERLNWLHRWLSRVLWLTATIHFAYWLVDWAPYDNFTARKFRTDPLAKRGLIAWSVLTWTLVSGSRPVRCRGYELFVIQHVASFGVMMYFIFHHVPPDTRIFVWLCVGIVCFDRLVRLGRLVYLNAAPIHSRSKGTVLSCQARFSQLDSVTTRITIDDPPLRSWQPGQHLSLSCPGLAPLQAHPFTIASLPSSNQLEFVVRAHSGATRRFLDHASKACLPTRQAGSDGIGVIIEGPYGMIRPVEQFASVVLFAGATGATFCVPIVEDIVARWTEMSKSAGRVAVTRSIRFVWAVKSREQYGWFASRLESAVQLAAEAGRELVVSVYVTCDDGFVGEVGSGGTADPVEVSYEKPTEGEPTAGETECCCRQTVGEDEKGGRAECCCGVGQSCSTGFVQQAPKRTSPMSVSLDGSARSLLGSTGSTGRTTDRYSEIAVLTGRPAIRKIIREMAERAEGEMAVLSCGPAGMMVDCRAGTVCVSDERACGRSTGASGIWYYGEGFGW